MSGNEVDDLPRPRIAAWLFEPIRANWRTYSKVALAAALINVFGLATALFTMTVYDRVLPNSAFTSLAALSIGLAIIVIFDFILKLLRAYFVDHAGVNIDTDVGTTVFQRLLEMRMELRKGSTGHLTGMMRELETLREFFASATLAALVDVPFILITLIVVAMIGGWVVLVPAILVPLTILIGLALQPAMERLSAKAMREGLLKQSVLVETIGSIESVKTSGAGSMFASRWQRAVDHHSALSLRQRMIANLGTTFATSAGTLSYTGVVIVGVFMVSDNRLTLGGLIACSILAGRAIAPLAQISQLVARLTSTRTAYRQVASLMEQPPEGPESQAINIDRLRGEIELRGVTFQYPDAANNSLDGINLSIKSGERVALLGRVGSGKSTLARLMLGLYPPQDGLVLMDGLDIGQLDPATMRKSIGSVLQDPALFSGSIRENIALGREEVDDAEMLRAAQMSGTDSFTSRIPRGYDLHLVDRGEGLSGGQRQSIAIARALAGKPPVLIMDEPSSAMDAQTEQALIARLKGELDGRTFVIVTHRQPLLALVDRIVFIEDGKITMDGPRNDVLAKLASKGAQERATS